MQISTREQDYIIDTLTLRSDMCMLNEVFTDPDIVKVTVNITDKSTAIDMIRIMDPCFEN